MTNSFLGDQPCFWDLGEAELCPQLGWPQSGVSKSGRKCLLEIKQYGKRVGVREGFLKHLSWDVCIWISRKRSMAMAMRAGVILVWPIQRGLDLWLPVVSCRGELFGGR